VVGAAAVVVGAAAAVVVGAAAGADVVAAGALVVADVPPFDEQPVTRSAELAATAAAASHGVRWILIECLLLEMDLLAAAATGAAGAASGARVVAPDFRMTNTVAYGGGGLQAFAANVSISL